MAIVGCSRRRWEVTATRARCEGASRTSTDTGAATRTVSRAVTIRALVPAGQRSPATSPTAASPAAGATGATGAAGAAGAATPPETGLEPEPHDEPPAHLPADPVDAADAVARSVAQIEPKTVGKFLFTSGSTGAPKGAVYTHGNFSAQVDFLKERFAIAPGEVDPGDTEITAIYSHGRVLRETRRTQDTSPQ